MMLKEVVVLINFIGHVQVIALMRLLQTTMTQMEKNILYRADSQLVDTQLDLEE